MAKKKQRSPEIRKVEPKKTAKPLVPEKYQDLVYIILIVVSVFFFFRETIFSDGTFNASDNIAHESFKPYLNEAEKADVFPQWIPYIFGGMPSYGSLLVTGDRSWDIVNEIVFGAANAFESISNGQTARLAFWYCFYAIGMYLLVMVKLKNRHIAFIIALAAVFSTGVIHWVMIGHNTKPVALATLPFLILLLEKVRERFTVLHGVLLAVILHVLFESNHVQMIFYVGLAAGLYILFELISRAIKKEEPLQVLKAAAVIVVAGGIAFAMSADRYLSILEYTPYSVRGSAPIEKEGKSDILDEGGNDYDYATMWSFSPQEIITFAIPNYYGFGKLEYSGPATGGQEVMMPTYWGQKPFEDVAPYMGIGILILAIIGFIYYRQNVFVQYLLAMSLFVLLLSFGSTLPVVYDFFFYYVPYFNKFRAPSMVLALMQFAVPVLAAYGIMAVVEIQKNLNKKNQRYLLYTLVFSGAFLLIAFIFGATAKDTYISWIQNSSNQMAANYATQLPEYANFIWSSMINDWYITALIAVIFAVVIYFFAKGKLSSRIFYASLAVLVLVDLWRVGYRAMDVQEAARYEQAFTKTDVISALQKDTTYFRISEIPSQNRLFASPNAPAYFGLENAGGYHAAKLRIWQDMMDVADQGSTSDVTNPLLWRLMNVKYLINAERLNFSVEPAFISKQTGHHVYITPGYLDRVFFVDTVEVATEMQILKRLKAMDLEPQKLALIEKDLGTRLDKPTAGSKAFISEHDFHYIKINATATGNNFLFVSEIYYPESWTAYIDGKETEIIKTNFGFRGIVVPDGEHVVEMKFKSDAFQTGKSLSIAGNIITFLLLGLGLFINFRNNNKKNLVKNVD